MDQKKIGRFIAQARKEKSLTQTELGELLGVTNKTVSRWETGNYMPDLSLLQSLCNELNISINEFLSGEKLDIDDYYEHAEKNILSVLEHEEQMKKQKNFSVFFSGAGTGLLASMLYAPDTTRKAIIIIVAVAMIFTGWYFRSKLDKNITSSKK